MPEQIIDATGQGYGMVVNSDGSINISGVDITIGSLALALESVYVQSGANIVGSAYEIETIPTAIIKNNPEFELLWMTSGTAIGVTGSEIGSIVQHIGTGSYVQVLTYSNNQLTNVGSWV